MSGTHSPGATVSNLGGELGPLAAAASEIRACSARAAGLGPVGTEGTAVATATARSNIAAESRMWSMASCLFPGKVRRRLRTLSCKHRRYYVDVFWDNREELAGPPSHIMLERGQVEAPGKGNTG